MKTYFGTIVAVLAFCCALVVGPATRVAAEECTGPTQGAMALALADVLGIEVTRAQAAADALANLGVGPKLGWNVEACLTDAVAVEIEQSFAALNHDAGDFQRALGMIGRIPDRVYPTVSPVKN